MFKILFTLGTVNIYYHIFIQLQSLNFAIIWIMKNFYCWLLEHAQCNKLCLILFYMHALQIIIPPENGRNGAREL